MRFSLRGALGRGKVPLLTIVLLPSLEEQRRNPLGGERTLIDPEKLKVLPGEKMQCRWDWYCSIATVGMVSDFRLADGRLIATLKPWKSDTVTIDRIRRGEFDKIGHFAISVAPYGPDAYALRDVSFVSNPCEPRKGVQL